MELLDGKKTSLEIQNELGDKVKKLVQGFEGAKYKSFLSKEEANKAIKKKYSDYQGKGNPKKTLSNADKANYGVPLKNSLTVDAACSGNPGKMEYRGVLHHNNQEVFKMGPYENGTNNINNNSFFSICSL